MKALVGAFNQDKALVGAFSVIVNTDCETNGSICGTRVLSATLRGNTGQQEVNSIVMMLFYCQPIISTFETFLIRPCNHASVEIICSRSMYYYYLFEWANEIVIQKRYKHLLEKNNLSSMHNTHKMNCIISITFKT